MTPTRYPGWRILAILMGLLNAAAVYPATLVFLRVPTSWITVHAEPADPSVRLTYFLSFLCFAALNAVGALVSIRLPARGFLLFGAGNLANALLTAVLHLQDLQALKQTASLLVAGAGYTWLGFRQLEADRSTPE
jgi:hypothetical protein